MGDGSESVGLVARSESGIAPACDRGGWGAVRSLGTGLLAMWVMVDVSFQEVRAPYCRFFITERFSIGLERIVWLVQTAQF
jgi:hypothetical protein